MRVTDIDTLKETVSKKIRAEEEGWILKTIDEAEVIEIVQCRDCIHVEYTDESIRRHCPWCTYYMQYVLESGFCSVGQAKEVR